MCLEYPVKIVWTVKPNWISYTTYRFEITFNEKSLSFSRDYIIPRPMDPRLCHNVAKAVAQAAVNSGVAALPLPAKYLD